MSYEPCDIFIKDKSPFTKPVEGAVVRVYSEDGRIPFTQVTTDADGHAGFLLPSSATYQLRFFKFGVSFQNPRYITVSESPTINTFDISVDLVTPPASSDPRLCIAYGYFRDVTGAPAPNVDVQFIAKFKPLLLDGSALLIERRTIRTDASGYAQIPLIRFGQYDVTMQGQEDYQRCISVPDAPNVNLPDLLFPVVAAVIITPPGPVVLAVNEQRMFPLVVLATDGNPVDITELMWSSSDQAVMGVGISGSTLTLTGQAAGTAYVNAKRSNLSIIRIPDPGVLNIPIQVTVQ